MHIPKIKTPLLIAGCLALAACALTPLVLYSPERDSDEIAQERDKAALAYCAEIRAGGGWRPEDWNFIPGERYGDFVFEKSVDVSECISYYYFIGTTTVSGTYRKNIETTDSNDDIHPHFYIDKSDLAKLPGSRDLNPFGRWESSDLEQLFAKDGSDFDGYTGGWMGTATITVTNPVLGRKFTTADIHLPDTLTVIEVIRVDHDPF